MGKTKWILAVASCLILAGAIGVSAMDSGEGAHGGGHGVGFFDHLKQLGQHLHRGDTHDRMADLFDEMQLTDAQRQHLTKIHEAVETVGHNPQMSMEQLHGQLMGQFMEGHVDAELITGMIDSHLEEMRSTAYQVTHQLVELVNGLDGKQREILMQHVNQMHGDADGHGHGH